jgi:phosphatidylinositol alpha-1,6-mannosyltransferase
VGRLCSADTYKGFDTLIEAMPLVLRDFPHARLRIVGGGDDAPRLQALAAQLAVAAAVVFTGIISDEALRAEYAACDLFALPSRNEGFGLVFLEAMIFGKPCIGARAGGVPEVITEDTGVLVEYGDVPGIAAAIAALSRDWDEAAILAWAQQFSYSQFVPQLAFLLASHSTVNSS